MTEDKQSQYSGEEVLHPGASAPEAETIKGSKLQESVLDTDWRNQVGAAGPETPLPDDHIQRKPDLDNEIALGNQGHKTAGWEMVPRKDIQDPSSGPETALNERDATELKESTAEIAKGNPTRNVDVSVNPVLAGSGISAQTSPIAGQTYQMTEAQSHEMPISQPHAGPHATENSEMINGFVVANEFLTYHRQHPEIGDPQGNIIYKGSLISQVFSQTILHSQSGQIHSEPLGTMSKINEANQRIYTVQPGERLFDIAYKFYGNGLEYPRILAANPQKIDNPDLPMPGLELLIP